MTRRLLLAMAALAAALLLIGSAAPVAAQSNGTAPNGTAATTERIDANTVLVESGYDPDTGMASVTIRSDTLQQIVVTDAGAFMEGGEIARREAMVKPGETTTIKIPATETRGFVGVSISTPQTLYAVPLEVGTGSIFDGEASWGTVRLAGAAGFFGGLIAVVGLAYYRKRGGRREVDQVV